MRKAKTPFEAKTKRLERSRDRAQQEYEITWLASNRALRKLSKAKDKLYTHLDSAARP